MVSSRVILWRGSFKGKDNCNPFTQMIINQNPALGQTCVSWDVAQTGKLCMTPLTLTLRQTATAFPLGVGLVLRSMWEWGGVL